MSTLREASIAGVYQTGQGDLSERDAVEVWWECAERACADAGISVRDVDGLIGAGPEGVGLRSGGGPAGLADVLGRPIRFHATSSVGVSAASAGFNLAVYAVSHGLAKAVLIVNAVAGRGAGYTSADRNEAIAMMAKLSGPYEYPFGTTPCVRLRDPRHATHVRVRNNIRTVGGGGGGATPQCHAAAAVAPWQSR